MQFSLSGVRKSYGTRTVLKELDLSVDQGEFIAVVGASGSGKSTLLRLLAGLERPDDGSITIDDHGLTGINEHARLMFQDARLLPWRCVLDNVRLAAGNGSQDAALEALRSVGLADRAGDWPAVLSGGQRQRVALARALVSRPPLLLLDEPLGSLDALTRIEMQDLLERVWMNYQFTAVLVTHDTAEAVRLAERVLVIEHGRIGLELDVPFKRPRERSDGRFSTVEQRLLRRLLNRGDPDLGRSPIALLDYRKERRFI
jgi:sulfonate transport system ATP-binding protein